MTLVRLDGHRLAPLKETPMQTIRWSRLSLAACAVAATCACGGGAPSNTATTPAPNAGGGSATVIRITGSDTMINLVQAWAENYRKKKPDVSVQVAGGGSGVGIAGLIDGILDLAAASREMEPKEIERATQKNGHKPAEYSVALDALSVYVHKDNPIDTIALPDLAEIYGDKGSIDKWSQLGGKVPGCSSDTIVRVGRQNSSGTYVYFREAVLGAKREYKLGSIDQSGSKDVVALVGRTPCAVGYSGMAYLTPEVKALKVSKAKGDAAVAPSNETAMNKTYPLARALYFYSPGEPKPQVKEFLDWVHSAEGQKIVKDVGFVPIGGPSS
jgi:phosphate transport system substrate-binding protein